MKTLAYSIIFFFVAQYTYAQEIDKDGRTAQDRAKQTTSIQPSALKLQQSQIDKGSQEVVVEFAFPATVSRGEMRLFHPRVDKELALFALATTSGQVRIPLTSLVSGIGIVGLYGDGKLLQTLRVSYE